jgi:hypothetical protein
VTRTRGLQLSAISIPSERDAVQSTGADCGDLRWATVGLDFSGERSVVASEGDLVASRGGRCQPGLTIASYVAATNQVVAGTEVPPIQGEPGGRRLGRSPGALPFDSAAGAAGVYSGGYAEARLIGGALSTPGGVRREGDLIGETGNPREDARARPEGKNRPIHRRRTNR